MRLRRGGGRDAAASPPALRFEGSRRGVSGDHGTGGAQILKVLGADALGDGAGGCRVRRARRRGREREGRRLVAHPMRVIPGRLHTT